MIVIPSRAKTKINAEINIVPYIDVMLVLLIIFMMTTPIIEQGVEVDLPQAEAEIVDYTEQQPTIITVTEQGEYYINTLQDISSGEMDEGEKVSLNRAVNLVIARLEIYPQMQVFVRGDKDVYYGSVIQLMALLRQGGVAKVGMITESPE